MKIDGSSNSRKPPEPKVTSKFSKQSAPHQNHGASPDLKTFGDFTFDVNVVTSKFSKALQEKLNEEPPSIAANGHYAGINSQDLYSGILHQLKLFCPESI